MRKRLTVDEAMQKAKLCSSKRDFQDEFCTAWKLLRKHPNLYAQATAHMKNPLQKWDKETVLVEAKKYSTPAEFQLKAKGAYWSAQQNGWLNEAMAHMDGLSLWTFPLAQVEAKKYTRLTDFRANSRGAYEFLKRNSKLTEACTHMEKRFTWTPETALKLAQECETRQELKEKSGSCYEYIIRTKLGAKAFKHMKEVINFPEKVSQAKFEDKLRTFLKKEKINFVMLKEFHVTTKSTHRVDMFINLIPLNLKIAIEYKADTRHWVPAKIETQRKFYQKHLTKHKVKETYLISPNGKYGWSDDKFFTELKKMIKTKKVVKYS